MIDTVYLSTTGVLLVDTHNFSSISDFSHKGESAHESVHIISESIISESRNIISESIISESKNIISESKHIISESKHIISESLRP